MALLGKNELQYAYSWKAYGADDPKVTGKPDSTLCNRSEGYEVLYLINSLAEKHGWVRKTTGLNIEKMIHDRLPSSIRSQKEIIIWLEEHM